MPKVATLIRCYGLTRYLEAVIKQYAWVDKILVMNYRFRDVIPREDRTREVALSLGLNNVEVDSGESTDLHQTLNIGLDKLSDYESVFISDADELIATNDQKRILEETGNHAIALSQIIDYARDFNHRFPVRSHQHVVLIKQPNRFNEVRCCFAPSKSFTDIYVHHLGYVFPKEEMDWKVNWEKPWEHNTVINLLAQLPEDYEMPDEIKRLLNA